MSNAYSFGWACSSGSSVSGIRPPTPESGIMLQASKWDLSDYFLPGHSQNGDFVSHVLSTGQTAYINSSRSQVWSKTATQIKSGDDYIITSYFSATDDKYYVVTIETASNVAQLSSLNKTTGAVTNLGSTFGTWASGGYSYGSCGMCQLASGNLLIISTDDGSGAEGRIIEITTSGSVSSNAEITQNGIKLFDSGMRRITYQSQDGTIFAGTTGEGALYVARGGTYRIIDISSIFRGALLTMWNGYVAIVCDDDDVNILNNSPSFFNLTDFDRWLDEICTAVGI